VATFVLVHGAWHGGWIWERVRHTLESPGHRIYSPTLTGLGERAHLASREVGLDTHIEDVLNVVKYQGLNEIILVGHSYAGVVITAVADRIPENISRIAYLDAVIPRHGQSFFDSASSGLRDKIEPAVMRYGDGWKIPVRRVENLGLVEREDIDWVMPRLVPHPYRTFCDRVQLQLPVESLPPRSYINCIRKKPRGGPRSLQAEGIDDYHEISTGHDAMITAPGEVAELLNKIAGI
jgi:pimeloyl-ACP methyl ester carboxylesterase